MRNVLIVAAREFRQIAAMRSFWLTLLILPIALGLGPLAARFLRDDSAARVMIVDRAGGAEAKAIETQLVANHERHILIDLSRYVRRHHLEKADPQAPWASSDRWYSDADVARFTAAGGVDAALARIASVKPEDVPDFKPPKGEYEFVPVPASIANTPDVALEEPVQAALKPADGKAKAVDYILLIPASFGETPDVRLWSNRQPAPQFVAAIQDVLTANLRTRFLERQGISADSARSASAIAPALAISTPPPGGGAREAMLVRSILPLIASYMLMMSLMLSGSWMLQGTVEERSNKLLETVIACVSPNELMYGKLLGTVGVGLFMIAVWIACGMFAAYFTHGAIADLIRPALDPLTSPGTILTIIYFFVVGYVAISVMFLAIGSMSNSMGEAQGYLMPVMLVILLPITFLLQSVVAGKTGGIAMAMLTWIPIWTPFSVLARLGAGIPTWEVIGSGLVLAAFTIAELVLIGRLFRASLLAQGQRPGIAEVISRMRRNAA